jgi:hypothetical protein
MRFRQCWISIAVLAVSVSCFAQKEDWLPISQQELQMKEVPGAPAGASAVRLHYAVYFDDNTFSQFYYTRIKILNEKAREPEGPADVNVPVLEWPFYTVLLTELKARTIHPDGSIVEYTGKPFEKTIFKGRGLKVAVKAFTMPDVTVGSIIEYKYKYIYQRPNIPGFFFPPEEWILQSDLFTVSEHFHFRPFEGGGLQSSARANYGWDGAQIAFVAANLKEKPRKDGNEVELEAHNVPAFVPEDQMPPEDDFKPTVRFFYNRRGSSTVVEKAWQEIGKDRYESHEEFMGKNHGVREAALQAIGAETDPVMKLRKLYERVQKIRNLTFERGRTSEERKKENLKQNLSVGDVLEHGYGYSDGITMLFVAMARAVGMEASVVQVSDRSRRFFNKEMTSRIQLDEFAAAVTVNGQDMFFEPGTRFCPFGVLRWTHTATEGLKLDKKGGVFVKAQPAAYDKSVTRRNATAAITEDGTLKGTVVVEFRGYDALEHRLDAIDRDDAGKKKDLEDEMKQWLPRGSLVQMITVQGWEESDQPLMASFSIEVPAYASLAGKRLLVPTSLFQVRHKEAFKHSERKYPVYFSYPFAEYDSMTATVPAGFTLENVPPQQEASLPFAKYQNVSQFDGHQLVAQRKLLMNGIYFATEKYAELKGFFSKVQTGDEQQAVLHGGSGNAQKGN